MPRGQCGEGAFVLSSSRTRPQGLKPIPFFLAWTDHGLIPTQPRAFGITRFLKPAFGLNQTMEDCGGARTECEAARLAGRWTGRGSESGVADECAKWALIRGLGWAQ